LRENDERVRGQAIAVAGIGRPLDSASSRIKVLTSVQSRQDINVAGIDDADVFELHQQAGRTAVHRPVRTAARSTLRLERKAQVTCVTESSRNAA